MGRKTIEIKKIKDNKKRQITFNKRRAGVLKKAMELSILCGCPVAVAVYETHELGDAQWHVYESQPDFLKQCVDWNTKATEKKVWEPMTNEDYFRMHPTKKNGFVKEKQKVPTTRLESGYSAILPDVTLPAVNVAYHNYCQYWQTVKNANLQVTQPPAPVHTSTIPVFSPQFMIPGLVFAQPSIQQTQHQYNQMLQTLRPIQPLNNVNDKAPAQPAPTVVPSITLPFAQNQILTQPVVQFPIVQSKPVDSNSDPVEPLESSTESTTDDQPGNYRKRQQVTNPSTQPPAKRMKKGRELSIIIPKTPTSARPFCWPMSASGYLTLNTPSESMFTPPLFLPQTNLFSPVSQTDTASPLETVQPADFLDYEGLE